MFAFILRRLAQSAGVILAMIVLVFFGVNVVGDPTWILVSADMTLDQIEETRRGLGLDRPIWEQFWIFLKGALKGDLGRSFVHGEPAIKLILSRMPATLELAFAALMLAIFIGIPLGLYAGLKPDSKISRTIMATSILGFSLPTFWVGLMMILIFSVMLGWLPATGRGQTAGLLGWQTSLLTANGWSHILLPALNLALLKISLVIRLARAGAREAALMDYVKFARAKGLSQSRIVGVHILKNIMIPIVTVLGLEFGSLVAFSVVTETIFAWPGMGKLLLEAIQRLDRPVIVAYVIVVVVLFVTINLLVDIVYSLLESKGSVVGGAIMTDVNLSITKLPPEETAFQRFVSRFCEDRVAVFGLVLVILVTTLAILAPWITPQNPYDLAKVDLMDSKLSPGEMAGDGYRMWLGSDGVGRDLYSGILYGLRISLMVGAISGIIAATVGMTVGLTAAYAGGRVESFIMRVVDLQLSLPTILVALILVAMLGKGVDKIIIALVVVQWAYYARTVRGSALVERRKEYIEAAQSLGLSHSRIIFKHILPNVLAPIIVIATVQTAHAIALEATLSFLGVGLPQTEPSLGVLIANGFQYLLSGKYWISTFPGLALLITIVAINLVGDRLRDVLNPRLEK